MKHTRICVILLPLLVASTACAVENRYYGEPVSLKGRYLYFTSWKYIRQGTFTWKIEREPTAGAAEQNIGSWLEGDGTRAARFEPIDMPRGIRLVAQPATKVPFQPGQMAATLFDNGKYKAWYTLSPSSNPEPTSGKNKILPGYNAYIAYAESTDGVQWDMPKLGLFEHAGNRDNNIVLRNDLNGSIRGFHGGCVFLDPSSKDERFKMLHLGLITDQEWAAFEKKYPGETDSMARRPDVGGYRCVVAVYGAVSPDGIHWTPLSEPLMIQHADTLNSCYYDIDRKQYVAYVRTWQVNERAKGYVPDDSAVWIGVGRRSIGRAVSKDFRHFTPAEVIVGTGADMAPSHVWYTNGKTTLPCCPDNHVMFPWLWELEKDAGDTWLMSSTDGWTWTRVPGGPVVSAGKPGQRDGSFVLCSGELLEYPGDKWCITYSGVPIPHKYPGRDISQRKGLFPGVEGVSGLATWPKGRLVALQCDEEGEFATVAMVPPGDRIRLNASVLPTGYIRVAVGIFDGGQIKGRAFADADRFVGDGLAMPVTWKGEANMKHGGKPVILRFQMRQAKLYGVEFY